MINWTIISDQIVFVHVLCVFVEPVPTLFSVSISDTLTYWSKQVWKFYTRYKLSITSKLFGGVSSSFLGVHGARGAFGVHYRFRIYVLRHSSTVCCLTYPVTLLGFYQSLLPPLFVYGVVEVPETSNKTKMVKRWGFGIGKWCFLEVNLLPGLVFWHFRVLNRIIIMKYHTFGIIFETFDPSTLKLTY